MCGNIMYYGGNMRTVVRGFTILVLLFALTASLYAGELRVGVVIDGPSAATSSLLAVIEEEAKKLVDESEQVIFSESLLRSGDWSVENTRKAVQAFLDDRQVNIVFAVGPVASQQLANIGKKGKVRKPVIATHILNASMQQIEKKDGSSGITNFTYIDSGYESGRHIDKFQEIINFKTLHLLASPFFLDGIPGFVDTMGRQAAERGVKLVVVPVGENMARLAADLEGAEAVYLASLSGLSEDRLQQVLLTINSHKLPSMSMTGLSYVNKGAFCSVSGEVDAQKLARRIALNLQRIIMNDDPANFQVDFTHPERLAINMQTAREIELYPTWEQMTDAVLINEESADIEKKLTITQVIETALLRNLQAHAKKRELEAGEHKIDRARSGLRPKLSAFGRQTVIDDDRAANIMTPGKHVTQLGADLLHVLYSEQAQANIDIQKLFQSARREEERALMLDIIKEAAIAYLNVLKTRTLQNIQRDNLEVTRANLEIARFREQVGTSGPAEVYRWEIQMAGARQSVIEASAMRKKAEMALNQVLSAAQEEEFATADCDIFSEVFFLDYQKVAPYIDNQAGYKLFRDFLVADTFAFSPEIQQISRGIEAMDRSKRSARRRFNQPVVALQGNISRTVRESGAGADKPAMPAPFGSVFKYPDKNDWYIGLNVSIPLHEGGDRKAAVKEAEATLRKLEAEREYLMQRLELNTRASLEDARASFASIRLAKTRAGFAARTLDLVQSAYSRGAVNILDLIDAQNASLVAREASANAVFSFLSDFVKVCRAVGTFDFILDQASNNHWYERLFAYFATVGGVRIHERRSAEYAEPEPASNTKVLYGEL